MSYEVIELLPEGFDREELLRIMQCLHDFKVTSAEEVYIYLNNVFVLSCLFAKYRYDCISVPACCHPTTFITDPDPPKVLRPSERFLILERAHSPRLILLNKYLGSISLTNFGE